MSRAPSRMGLTPKQAKAFGLKAPDESAIGQTVARFLTLALPDGWEWTHIANGGARHKATAGKLRAEGVRTGAPDYVLSPGRHVILPREGRHIGDPVAVVWIELKSQDGALSPEQRRWRRHLVEARGSHWFLCRSDVEVEAALRVLLGAPLRATCASAKELEAAAARVRAADDLCEAYDERLVAKDGAAKGGANRKAAPGRPEAALISTPRHRGLLLGDRAENTAEPTVSKPAPIHRRTDS